MPIPFEAKSQARSYAIFFNENALLSMLGDHHSKDYYEAQMLKNMHEMAAALGFVVVPLPVTIIDEAA